MRLFPKLFLRSFSCGILAAIIAPVSGFAHSEFEIQASQIAQDPYANCGRIETELGGQTKVASGAIATPGVVLTVADVLWNSNDGFATKVLFQRGRRGPSILETSKATYIVLIKKFTTATGAVARNTTNVAGLFFRTPPAGGHSLDLRATLTRLVEDNQNEAIGYDGAVGNGNRMVEFSGLTFTKIGGVLYTCDDPSQFPSAMKGAPVLHFNFNMRTGVVKHLFVGIIVDTGITRGFSAAEVKLFGG